MHGVAKPDVGLCPHVPHGGIPWNNIDNFGQQVDDSLVILMLEMAICLLKPLLNMLDKASVMIIFYWFSDDHKIVYLHHLDACINTVSVLVFWIFS